MEKDKDNFRQALHTIVEIYGSTLLNDARRTNAFLMDYAPNQAKERKLIISALNEGIGTELIKNIEKGQQEQQLCINRCIRTLVSEAWVTEAAANFAVNTIASAIGIKVDHAADEKESKTPEHHNLRTLSKGVLASDLLDYKTCLLQYQVIDYKAFASNINLINLELPQGIKIIKTKAFLNCINLKTISIPSSVDEMGLGVFIGCDSLERITIDRNPRYTVVNGVLIDKKNKALLRATRIIGERCNIPREITSIQAYAFERSPLSEIMLPRNLTHLDMNAFSLCGNLKRFDIDVHNEHFATIDGVVHSKDKTRLIRFPSGYTGVNYIIEDSVSHIADGAFSGTAHIETITFTSNLKSIGANAFEYCRTLSSLVLPSSIEIIGERAFQYCDHLSSIMLPRGIQEIGDYAFCGCSEIQTLNIPKSVKKIGHSAFKDCMAIKKIIIQDNVEFIGDGAFAGCSNALEVAIKNNKYVEQYCTAHKITWSAL